MSAKNLVLFIHSLNYIIMKKFLSIVIIWCSIFGFSTSLMAQCPTPTGDNPANYFDSKYWVCKEEATPRINAFPRHKTVAAAYVRFDTADLKSVIKNLNNIDSVVFRLAVRKDDKNDSIPTVLMVCYMKKKPAKILGFNDVQYIDAQTYCPPPPDGCFTNKRSQ